ncbi:DUF1428 domain-containing protein [Frigidibacter sp. MR17.24]|uniref:DUF1428 domain-containing protein n=1 Tax=Frigidibacter sp. MR17.24 TaxID=3127345 RepID=UPI003012D63C
MGYVEGFVTPVPVRNRDAYVHHAERAVPFIAAGGMTRFVEAWGEDLPEGKVTDFRRAVLAEPDEAVLFSWFEYPDRAVRDRANARMASDPAAEAMMEGMPFDAGRMIWSGFEVVSEVGTAGPIGHIDGMLAPAPADGRARFAALGARVGAALVAAGASRVVDCWGDDLLQGVRTDYPRAVAMAPGETVVWSWIEWPSAAAREAGWAQVMAAGVMPPPDEMPFCPRRMIHGGFRPILQV